MLDDWGKKALKQNLSGESLPIRFRLRWCMSHISTFNFFRDQMCLLFILCIETPLFLSYFPFLSAQSASAVADVATLWDSWPVSQSVSDHHTHTHWLCFLSCCLFFFTSPQTGSHLTALPVCWFVAPLRDANRIVTGTAITAAGALSKISFSFYINAKGFNCNCFNCLICGDGGGGGGGQWLSHSLIWRWSHFSVALISRVVYGSGWTWCGWSVSSTMRGVEWWSVC